MAEDRKHNMSAEDLAFKNRKVFTSQDEIFGLPASIFGGGLALSVALAVALFWWMFFLTALLYYPPMYHIHKDDPRGLKVWTRALKRRYSSWAAGRSEARELVIISERRR